MSTSFRDGFPGNSDSQAQGLSLRKFLSEGVFVGAEDILVTRCAHRAQDCQPGDVFIPHHSAAGDQHDHRAGVDRADRPHQLVAGEALP